MNSLLEIRGHFQQIYSERTGIINRVLRFVINILIFFLIQSKMGYLPSLSRNVITIALAVICTFLPRVCTCIIAAVVILLQLTAASLGIVIVIFVIFALVFIFYLRFTSNQSMVLVLTVVAFALNIPVIVPVVAGLLGGMVTIIPLVCGTIVYYVLHSANSYASGITEEDGMVTVLSDFAKTALQNKGMVVAVVAIVLGVILVNVIKKLAVSFAWYAAIGVGAVASAVVLIMGGAGLNTSSVGLSTVIAIIVGIVIKFMIFNVDYSRVEQVQFEDDEYYYYVKAVPKNGVKRKKKK